MHMFMYVYILQFCSFKETQFAITQGTQNDKGITQVQLCYYCQMTRELHIDLISYTFCETKTLNLFKKSWHIHIVSACNTTRVKCKIWIQHILKVFMLHKNWRKQLSLKMKLNIMLTYLTQSETLNHDRFHQPRLVIRTFHRQGRCSRGGHLCNEHSEEKYSCSYK